MRKVFKKMAAAVLTVVTAMSMLAGRGEGGRF